MIKWMKLLAEKNIIIRQQKNLSNGGYIYTYESNSKSNIRRILKDIINNWSNKVEERIDRW